MDRWVRDFSLLLLLLLLVLLALCAWTEREKSAWRLSCD